MSAREPVVPLRSRPRGIDSPRAKPVAPFEPWLAKNDLAAALGFSVRWVEYRVAEGMPHRRIGGRLRFQLSSVEDWLDQHEPRRAA